MSLTLFQSKQPQIIKLHSIDRSYRMVLNHKFSIAAQSLGVLKVFPLKFVRKYQQLLSLLNDAIFNYITIIKVRKTFGEEYTYLNLYNPEDYKYEGTPLGKEKRALLFFFNTFGFSIIKFLFKKLYTELLQDCKADHNGRLWRIFISFFPEFDDLVERVNKLVLMLFLIKADYFNIQERLLKIKFIYLRKSKQTKISYKKEGYLMLLQNVIELVSTLFSIYKVASVEKRRQESYDAQRTQLEGKQEFGEQTTCIICSETISNKSVTACGHVFCWQCIIKSTEIKPQCPNCRKKCLPSQVIQLKNY